METELKRTWLQISNLINCINSILILIVEKCQKCPSIEFSKQASKDNVFDKTIIKFIEQNNLRKLGRKCVRKSFIFCTFFHYSVVVKIYIPLMRNKSFQIRRSIISILFLLNLIHSKYSENYKRIPKKVFVIFNPSTSFLNI